MITLIFDQINGSQLCSFDRDYRMDCVSIDEIDKIDRLADNNPENDKQVNGYFKVAMFNDPNKKEIVGNGKDVTAQARFMDDEMLQIMAKMLNFTPVYLNNSNDYGYLLPNGTLVGTLGEIEHGRADLANSRVISDIDGASNVEFLFPLTFVRFKFVVPKNYYRNPKREINVAVLPQEFVPFYLSVIFWFPVGYKLMEHYHSKWLPSQQTAKISWVGALTLTFAAMTNRSIKILDISSQRVYWMSLIWFQLIVYSVFQGRMIEEVSSAKYSREIETIDDLMETPLKLLLDASMVNYFNFSESAFKKYNLNDRITYVEKQPDELMSMIIKNRSVAVLLPERIIRRMLPGYYDPKSGVDLLYVIPESTYEFYVAMYLPATSRFIEPLNQITMRCVESGIVSFRMSYTLFSANLVYLRRLRMGKFNIGDERVAMVGWSTLEPFFISSIVMFSLACITFVFEILTQQMFKKINPKKNM
ncbi:uncharacterized protein LOC129762112 [Toxorhynchites rutilus septentrionalis]|uniref:uncharacterized protein LOC129762112 n=1 Tax=Toxorhynchites rutilus septentrionalis TaxID=329112 RepID=UPI002478B523|nr:uncharacterized protein LOC129762112 [Toxorhynchites rutilus septentrionalis]